MVNDRNLSVQRITENVIVEYIQTAVRVTDLDCLDKEGTVPSMLAEVPHDVSHSILLLSIRGVMGVPCQMLGSENKARVFRRCPLIGSRDADVQIRRHTLQTQRECDRLNRLIVVKAVHRAQNCMRSVAWMGVQELREVVDDHIIDTALHWA
jgi:hypothetical protein